MLSRFAALAALASCASGAPATTNASSSTDPQAGGLSKSQPIPQLLKDNPDLFYLPQPTAAPGIDSSLLPPSNQSGVHALDGNWFGTGLFGYDECKKRGLNKAKIDDAFYDMFYLTNIDGVSKDIDWNSAAALEYLGPSANNKDYQSRIQKLLFQASQTSYNWHTPNAHYIHVRCDDPAQKCSNPCGPDGTDGGSSDTIAYASQRDEKGYSQINFCPKFFDMRRLRTAAIDYGKGRPFPQNYWADKYDNTARVFLHELMHLDYFMDVSGSDHVWDMTIQLTNGKITNAYGPTNAKIMARYQKLPPDPTEPTSGYYISRNSDSMAWYANVRYVQNELGGYPHLPIVSMKEDGPPWKDPGFAFYSVYTNGSNPTFNISSSVMNAESDPSRCRDDTSNPTGASAPGTLGISGMAPDSAYPDSYNKDRSDWIKKDVGNSTSSTSTSTSSGPTSTPTCSGNQVEGNCKAGSLPDKPPYSGPQTPSCNKADGTPGADPRISESKLKDAVSGYCQNLVEGKVVLGKDNGNPKPASVSDAAENGGSLFLTTMYYETSCPTNKANSTLDFAAFGLQACFDSFFTVFNTVCVQDSTWQNYNKDYPEMGGTWGNNCGLFAVSSH